MTAITQESLAELGFMEAEGYWVPRDCVDRDFQNPEGTSMLPFLGFNDLQVTKSKEHGRGVQVSMFADWYAFENGDSLTFWKMTDTQQIKDWFNAMGQVLPVNNS